MCNFQTAGLHTECWSTLSLGVILCGLCRVEEGTAAAAAGRDYSFRESPVIELVDRERVGVHLGMLSFWAPNENFVGLSTISYTCSYYTMAGNSLSDTLQI